MVSRTEIECKVKITIKWKVMYYNISWRADCEKARHCESETFNIVCYTTMQLY